MEELPMLILLNIFILCHGLRDNVALYKDSRQSSTHYESGSPGSPFLANDGNQQQVAYQPPYDQLFCSSTITNDLTCWWAVDLGQEYSINSVTIFNRLDCCSDRLANIYVYVYAPTIADWSNFDQGSSQLCFYHPGLVPGILNAACNRNLQGRYVKIYKEYQYLNYGDSLTLCEVEVYIDKTPYTGKFCKQLNKEPLLGLPKHLQHVSRKRCAIYCRQTEGCLGFRITTEGACSLFKTSQKVDNANITVDYYERC